MSDNTLWMGAIQPNWTEHFLKAVFLDELNERVNVKLFKNNLGPYDSPQALQFAPRRATPIGYAFIEFRSHESAKLAKEKLQNKMIKDTNVVFRLNWAMRDKKKLTKKQEENEHSVFVGDLSDNVTNELLFNTFHERFPSCSSANVVVDPLTGHSKKYGFVRFSDVGDYVKAIETMNGVVVGSRAIRVGHATAKHGVDPITFAPPPSSFEEGLDQFCTVFVGNLDAKVGEEDLRRHFGDCGTIVSINIPQYKKGCGFIKFSSPEEAQKAISTKERSRLGESKIRLDWGRKRLEKESAQRNNFMAYAQQPQPINVVGMPEHHHQHMGGVMNSVASMQGIGGLGTPTFAYNYNYFGYVTKPNSYGFYNINSPQHHQPQIFHHQQPPFSTTVDRTYNNRDLGDINLRMNKLDLSNATPAVQEKQQQQQPTNTNSNQTNASPPFDFFNIK